MNFRRWALWGASCLLVLLVQTSSNAAIVNGYAVVTALSGTSLTVTSVDETNDTFEVGEQIILMQMQDNVIGANTEDNSSFGTLGSILSTSL